MSMHLTAPYQITKMMGELYANFYYHHYELPVVKTLWKKQIHRRSGK